MTLTKVGGTLWVCVDCMFANVNGEDPRDRPASEPNVWALWVGEPNEITPGATEHAPDCAATVSGCWTDCDGDCEVTTFSRARCDGCGSQLAGERHAFTWFE